MASRSHFRRRQSGHYPGQNQQRRPQCSRIKSGRNNVILETTTPHAIWLEDVGSGRTLKDIGLINPEYSDRRTTLTRQ
jgi:hypothetical protein